MRNRIPRHPDGSRDYRKLTAHERTVLATLYRCGAMAADDPARATRLSPAQLAAAVDDLCSPTRCAPHGATALEPVNGPDERAHYRVTRDWRLTHDTQATA